MDFHPKNSKDRLLRDAPRAARAHLKQHPEDWVFVVPDLYPLKSGDLAHSDANGLRDLLWRLYGGKDETSHFRPHVLVHDLEALLLAHPSGLERVLKPLSKLRTHQHPERVNHDKPPKKHVDELFWKHTKRPYNDVMHGPDIVRDADPAAVAELCPEGFGRFWHDIVSICGGAST